MKKSIVLLITLMFITAIAALIIKNIDDTQKLGSFGNINKNLVQLQISIENINKEIGKFLKEKKDNLTELFEVIPESIPLEYGNISALVSMSLFDATSYYVFDTNISQQISDEDRMYVVDFYTLEQMIKDKNITNQKQIDFVLDNYIEYVRDDRILNIKEKFIPKKLPVLNDDNSTIEYVELHYSISLGTLRGNVDMIINTNNEKKEFYEVSIEKVQ